MTVVDSGRGSDAGGRGSGARAGSGRSRRGRRAGGRAGGGRLAGGRSGGGRLAGGRSGGGRLAGGLLRRGWFGGGLFGGGIEGNEQLTAMVGVLLIALLAALGVTVLRIGQLIWPHLFLGLLLLGPVALKLASTGYRFARYYLGAAAYRAKGPPHPALRAMGPALVGFTLAVFASGIVLLAVGPRHRDPWLLLHKASFIVWLGLFGLHLLAHVPALPRSLRATRSGALGLRREALAGDATVAWRAGDATVTRGTGDATATRERATLMAGGATLLSDGAGAAGRWIVLLGALVAGLVVAIALIPHYGVWTAPGAFPHHHHG